ncbi:unnamed protein product, partial [marine sediment metagenome]
RPEFALNWGIIIGYIIKFYFMGKGDEADND